MPTCRRIASTRSPPAPPERRSAQTAMYVIADGLARLLAPILPVTTEEMWKHLPGQARSIGPPGGISALSQMSKRCSTRRWSRRVGAPDRDPRRGQSRTRGSATGENDRQLARCPRNTAGRAERPPLCCSRCRTTCRCCSSCLSSTSCRRAGEGPELEVIVTRAEGEKCARCWRIVPSVSSETATAGLCDRCVNALEKTHAA